MDQAITRAAGATPRAVGEFQGYVDGVDGIKPSVRWLDRKNMPQVGDRLFAIPARAAVPRSWSILLTSANHGTVGPVGSTFPHAGEKHERVQVMEIVEAGAAPAPGTDLGGLVRITIDGTVIPLAAPSASVGASTVLTDERIYDIAASSDLGIGDDEYEMSKRTAFARAIEREVAAQAKSEPLPDWISYDAAEDTLTMYGVKYSAGIFSTLGIAPVGRSFSIVARDNGVLVLTAAPVAAQAGQVAVPDDVARDAARYRWLCVNGYNRMPDGLSVALDAANIAGGGPMQKALIDQAIDNEMGLVAPAQAKPLPAPEVPAPIESIECWSHNEEDFNAHSLGELVDTHELAPGATVWVGEAVSPEPSSLFSTDWLIENMGEAAYDIAGEYAGEDYPNVSDEQVAELEALVVGWIAKCAPPTFWTVKNVRPYVLTAEDCPAQASTAGGRQEGDKS